MAILKSSTGQIILLGGGAMGALVAVALSTSGSGLCAQGSAYADGCSAAPVANANTAQYSTLLSSSYATRPPWNVAGVDYPVGIPAGTTLVDWQTISNPNIIVNTSTGLIQIGGSSITLTGIDFTGCQTHGCVGFNYLYVASNNFVLTNSKFGAGTASSPPNESMAPAAAVYQANGYTNLTFTNNWADGGGNAGNHATQDFFMACAGNCVIEYNYITNFQSEFLNVQNGTSNVTMKYNLAYQWSPGTGTHVNLFQESCTCTVNADIEYNTVYETYAASNGVGSSALFQFDVSADGETVTNDSITLSHNTMMFPSTGSNTGSFFAQGPYPLASTNGGVNVFNGPGVVASNYFDLTGTLTGGAFYPGSFTGWTGSGNINLVSGSAVAFPP
jgi:hypothetical protein